MGPVARGEGTLTDLALSGGDLDRCAAERVEPDLLPRCLADSATRVLSLSAGAAAVHGERGQRALDWRAPQPSDTHGLLIFLGRERGAARLVVIEPPAVATDAATDPGEQARAGLRSVGLELSASEAGIFATALALANWHATHMHCPRCGHLTEPVQAGWVRRCPADESLHFPRTDPAVIMGVVDDQDRLLLARGAAFRSSGMSVLAGFVEPGETFAAAVRREVHEEVGIEVDDVVPVGDQPWPFPNGIMIGFMARARSSELTLQVEEIQAARWFTRSELTAAIADGSVEIAGRISIARRLIEYWYGGPIDAPDVSIRR